MGLRSCWFGLRHMLKPIEEEAEDSEKIIPSYSCAKLSVSLERKGLNVTKKNIRSLKWARPCCEFWDDCPGNGQESSPFALRALERRIQTIGKRGSPILSPFT